MLMLVRDQQECNLASSQDVDGGLTCTKECPNEFFGNAPPKLKLEREDLSKKRLVLEKW